MSNPPILFNCDCSEFCREYLPVCACMCLSGLRLSALFLTQIQPHAIQYKLPPHGKESDVRQGCSESVNRATPLAKEKLLQPIMGCTTVTFPNQNSGILSKLPGRSVC